jgi:hypothetical protein
MTPHFVIRRKFAMERDVVDRCRFQLDRIVDCRTRQGETPPGFRSRKRCSDHARWGVGYLSNALVPAVLKWRFEAAESKGGTGHSKDRAMKSGKKRQSTKPNMLPPHFRPGSKSARAVVVLMEAVSDEEWHDRHALVAAVATETRLAAKTVSNLLHSLNGYGAIRRRGGYGMTRRRSGSLRQFGSRAPSQVAVTPLGRAYWDCESERFAPADTVHVERLDPTRNGSGSRPVTKSPGQPARVNGPMGEHCVTPRTDGGTTPDGSVPPPYGECGGCSLPFLPSRRDQRYCSAACRQRAYRRRHRMSRRHPVSSSTSR